MSNTSPSVDIARREHIGRLLLQASRAVNARAAAQLRSRGHPDIALAHIGLLPHVESGGTRLSTIAISAGMTKQAIGQLVHDLERCGYLTREADPGDRRATLVSFSDRGHALLKDATEITSALDVDVHTQLGDTMYQSLRSSLIAIVEGVSDQAP